MPTSFETLTLLDTIDLENHSLSIAATEYALDADTPELMATRCQHAQRIRRMEESETQDGAVVPALEELRRSVNVQDEREGQYRAHYALHSAIDQMVAAAV